MTPTIMAALPSLNLGHAELLSLDTLPPLNLAACPQFTIQEGPPGAGPVCGTRIRVVNQDTLDAAITLRASVIDSPAAPTTTDTTTLSLPTSLTSQSLRPANLTNPSAAVKVAVLNMASQKSPGGNWLGGSSAQEEAICFRSTLAISLRRSLYPLPARGGVYTADVAVFRTSMGDGHALMLPPHHLATDLPVVSVLTVAGPRRPAIKWANVGEATPSPPGPSPSTRKERERGVGSSRQVFANPAERAFAKDKMRLCLRMAASRGHTLLVLGAIGCGAFRNPPEEVAECWGEVLGEREFAWGWFREVWFAVFDQRGEGNFRIFRNFLDGKVVGRGLS